MLTGDINQKNDLTSWLTLHSGESYYYVIPLKDFFEIMQFHLTTTAHCNQFLLFYVFAFLLIANNFFLNKLLNIW